jgi:hypothetical protein
MWQRVAPALVLVLLAPFVGEVLLGSIPTHFLAASPWLPLRCCGLDSGRCQPAIRAERRPVLRVGHAGRRVRGW